jgi:hypothetical protein
LRDLRAELRHSDETVPVEWKPAEGDILVGSVRDISTDVTDAGRCAVVVEEERTGLPVLVSLDSPYLAALFELHKPRGADRIGIKYSGVDSDGVGRFTMVVDREDPTGKAIGRACADDGATSAQADDCGATPEERDYISHMLADSSSPQQENSDECPDDPIKGLLRRQEEEIGRQAKALERLESLIGRSQESVTSKPDTEPTATQPLLQSTKRPNRQFNWLRAIALWMALFMASGLGALTAVLLKPSLHLWFR